MLQTARQISGEGESEQRTSTPLPASAERMRAAVAAAGNDALAVYRATLKQLAAAWLAGEKDAVVGALAACAGVIDRQPSGDTQLFDALQKDFGRVMERTILARRSDFTRLLQSADPELKAAWRKRDKLPAAQRADLRKRIMDPASIRLADWELVRAADGHGRRFWDKGR